MKLLDGSGDLWQGGISVPRRRPPKPTPVPEPVNQAPIAGPDSATVAAVQIVEIAVLANDIDPEGGALSVTGATARNGSVTIGENSVLSYTPAAGFSGIDTITYTVADPKGATSEGTVTVEVTAPEPEPEPEPEPVNQAPVAGSDSATVLAGQTASIRVLGNDVDPEGGALTVTGATAGNGSITVGPDGTLSYTPKAGFSGTDTITYTVADPEGATSQGTVTVAVEAIRLSVEQSATDGTFVINAETGQIDLTITQPPEYAGSYAFDVDDLAQGPWNLKPPAVAGEATLTATPGLWVYDETFAPLQITRQWYRGGSAIPDAAEPSYAVQDADRTEGVKLVETAADAAGRRQVEIPALAPTAPSAAFAEKGVVFAGSAHLVRNADLGPDVPGILWFGSLTPASVSTRQGIVRLATRSNSFDNWDGRIRIRMVTLGGSARELITANPVALGERVHVLAALMPQGDGSVLRQLYTRKAGGADWVLEAEATSNTAAEALDLSTGSFVLGADNPPTGQFLRATLYRVACWAGTAVPDLRDTSVRNAFVTADGSALVDPAVSRSRFGEPLLDVHGPASDYLAGRNRGTAGNFDAVVGNITDA